MKKNTSEDDDTSEESDQEAGDNPAAVDLSKILPEEKVFLYHDQKNGTWYVVRPSDNQHVEVACSDPALVPVQVGDKWVLIVDSISKEAGSKPKYTQNMLGGRKAKAVSDSELLQECSKSGAYFFPMQNTMNQMISMLLVLIST